MIGDLKYCKKCGQIKPELTKSIDTTTCDVCSTQLEYVPKKYVENKRWREGDGREALYNELVKPSPEFDQYLFDHREEIRAKNRQECQEWLNYDPNSKKKKSKSNNSSYQPHCPTCGSPNVTKISVTRKAVGASLFGLFSKTARSQFQCSDCGYKW